MLQHANMSDYKDAGIVLVTNLFHTIRDYNIVHS